MKVAIVGGGPSAFYVASRLLSGMGDARELRVHVFDRLWAPHGLVRYGVAPDHPEVKNCTNKFDQVAHDTRFRFFGNVNVATPKPVGLDHAVQLPLADIAAHYSHLVFATGCTLPALHTALPSSPWCLPALSFVHWYTQHPSAPPPPPLHTLDHVSLIGNGNVALDIARILLTPPALLEKSDVPQPVLAELARSTVKHVDIIARRGPLQAAFTTKELRELINLPETTMAPLDPALLAIPPGTVPTRPQARTLQLLAQGSRTAAAAARRTWALHFYKSPVALEPPDHLLLVHTTLDADGRAVPVSDPPERLRTSLVVPSLGFHAEPGAPFFDPARGHLRAEKGRVIGEEGKAVRGVYASGWAATGARGVLASTMMDAYAVADAVIQDAGAGAGELAVDAIDELAMNAAPADELPPPLVREACAAGRVVEYADWKKVDEEEVRRGAVLGKERERMGWADAAAFLGRV
ncbi:ferredoxin adrenodoxin reductase [Mycena epipterygia]|nr:ferredoxin adrenodoxin reductase [Mycena epipterygia]